MAKPEQNNKRLFNKLFTEMSSVRKIKEPIEKVDNIKLTKSIKYLYYSKKSKMWFGHSETDSKYIYFFGIHEGHITQLNDLNNSIMIDFDKKNSINESSLGLITDDLSIYLNKNILEKKYPTVNSTAFPEHIIQQFIDGAKIELQIIDLGLLNNDFTNNLNKLISETQLKPTSSTNHDENTSMNLFLNSIKAGKNYEDSLKIANVGNSTVKNWYIKGKRGDAKYKEFYETYKEIMPKDKTISSKMDIFIVSMQTGKTENEALKKANISQSELNEWLKKGRNNELEYVDFYDTYKIFERNKPKSDAKNKNKELMAEYIKLINEGKTNKEVFETLNIPRFMVKNWKKQGQLGNKDYIEFYNTYLMAVNREELSKVKQFVDLINEGKTNEEAIKIIKMPKFKIKQWFNKGKNGEKDYIDFYKAYMKQYDKAEEIKIPKENPKPTIKKQPKKEKTCEICGRTINTKSNQTICKRCRRKQRCANIVQDLLPSIDPGIPFKKDDLKKIGLTGMQAQDYIWTLLEFSLIKKEKNNKYSLISKDKLDEFIKESGVEIKEIEKTTVKLTKTCTTCGKTLEISKFPVSESNPDGYDDNCKSCKKLITTAGYLKELLEHVDYDEEFNEDSLRKYYPDPFLLQAKVWSLLENDLLVKDNETNNYKLVNKETCEEFLEKYFKGTTPIKTTPPKPQPPKSTPTKPKPIKTKKQEQMDCVLKAMRNGKTRKQAAKLAGIPLYRITHWYKEGRDGLGEDNVYFFKELKRIEKLNIDTLKNQMKTVLKVLKSGGSKSKAAQEASIEESTIDEWIEKGTKGIAPYDSFKRKYDKIYKKSTDYTDKNNIRARKIFLENIKDGKKRKDAAKKASIDLKLIDSWIIKGTKGEKPYDEFYNEYKEAREIAKDKPTSGEEEIKQKFVSLLKEGYSHGEASRKIENGEYAIQIKKWYAAGKQGVKKHLKFYLDCQEAKNINKTNKRKLFTLIADGFTIKQACEKLNLNPVIIKEEILKGMDGDAKYKDFYLKIIESKTSLIDINQLFKSPNHPHKNQMIDVLDLLLIGESESEALKKVNVAPSTFQYWINRGKREFGELYTEFYQIYSKIKTGELIKQSQKEIIKELEKELDEIEDEDANILKPLPKKIRMQLDNLSGPTDTGFAWVNKIGNLWTYSRKIKGKNIKITDTDIHNLHKKVLKNNLMWGVRDLEKAKMSLEINDNPDDSSDTVDTNDILSPLPANIKTKFSKGTKTGFAWVNKIGNYYYYIRTNKNIRIKAFTIEELYQKVVDENLEWGVIDLTKAKQTLNQKEDKTTDSTPQVMNTNILAPLPKEIENELQKYSKGSSTGFAWVNKIGNKFRYERIINGRKITLQDENIYELHKKVISKNLTWGVRDLGKAKATLNEKTEIKTPKPKLQEVVTTDILAPLPEQFEDSFKSTKTNKTGIAWVNKIGNNWIYSRRVNEQPIDIKDPDIYKLHEKVISQGLTWGIRDYEKAKEIISVNEKGEPNESILKPLPIEIEQKLRRNSKGNISGFAWVSKVGDKWQYLRVIDGVTIHLKDQDIYKLHEIVIKNNHLWGVRDLSKAKQTLKECDKELPKPPKIDKIPNNTVQKSLDESRNKVFVVSNGNIVSIEGKIKNNEILKVLTKIYEFGDNIIKMNTEKMDNETSLSIELELNDKQKIIFKEKIKEFKWEIN